MGRFVEVTAVDETRGVGDFGTFADGDVRSKGVDGRVVAATVGAGAGSNTGVDVTADTVDGGWVTKPATAEGSEFGSDLVPLEVHDATRSMPDVSRRSRPRVYVSAIASA